MKQISLSDHADRVINRHRLHLSSPDSFTKEEQADGWDAVQQLFRQSIELAVRNPSLGISRPHNAWAYWNDNIGDVPELAEG
jgi:hypothetical protein